MRAQFLTGFLLAAMLAAVPASAQQNESRYTSVAVKGCKKFQRVIVGGAEFSTTHACRGLKGYEVVVEDTDLRTTVTVGFHRHHAKKQPAYEQGFAPFNSVNDNLEWRIDGKTKRPFAVIQRWLIADNENLDKNDRPQNVGLLVVTRIPPGAACHVAYIDVRANENPNALAQKAADELAKKFDCAKDKVHIVGNRGRAAELAGMN